MININLFIFHLPGLIILCAWFWHMLKTKTGLSIVLFICSLLSAAVAIFQQYYIITNTQNVNFAERTQVLSSFNVLSTINHFTYAVAFFVFINRLVQSKIEKEYNLLDDSLRQNNQADS